MSATRRPRYVVECDDWVTESYRTKGMAESKKAQIERAGDCRREHKVVEVSA